MNDDETRAATSAPSAISASVAPSPSEGKAENPWRIMDPVRPRIRLAMTLACVSAGLGVATLICLALTLRALLHGNGHEYAQGPWPPMLALAACTAATFALRLIAFNVSHYAAFRLEVVLRTQLAERVARLPLGRAQAIGAGQIAKVMQDDVQALHAFVADSTPLYARAYCAPIVTLIVLFWLDWRLALAALAVPALGFGLMAMLIGGSREINARYHTAREQVAAAIVEFVQAMPVVRTFDTGSASFGRYQAALAVYRQVLVDWYASVRFSARFSMLILSMLPTLTVLLWLSAWRQSSGLLAFDVWAATLLIGAGLAEAILPFMNLHHLIEKAKLSIGRIQQILAEPPLPEVPAPGAQPQDASVVFENVTFSYGAGEASALQNVSFSAPAGGVTALIGPSGAGKSTAARLIPRFWDVNEGRILVGGADVRAMTSDTLMRQVAFVFQDTFLFAGSIADNIRLGSPQATMDEVIAAARAAQAHDFIMALPGGYEARAGERGAFLSGGQRQRIAIARAILQNRPILVLDEATAFADPENEAALVQALSALMRGKTVLLVAHRLSTVQDADQILVFDHGRLVERGRHGALMTQGGRYARLWQSWQAAQGWSLPARLG